MACPSHGRGSWSSEAVTGITFSPLPPPVSPTDFLRHAPCLRLVKAEYETCARNYQTTMEELNRSMGDEMAENLNVTMYEAFQVERIRIVCCSFKTYVSCSERTVRGACGEETARFTRQFLDKMASSLMSVSQGES